MASNLAALNRDGTRVVAAQLRYQCAKANLTEHPTKAGLPAKSCANANADLSPRCTWSTTTSANAETETRGTGSYPRRRYFRKHDRSDDSRDRARRKWSSGERTNSQRFSCFRKRPRAAAE